jgi:RHH-type rel operon transcriptional repressor/antitoxin RelB
VIIAKLTVQMLYNSKSFVREVAIMTTENYNIRLEQDLKDRAFAVIESFGLSPAQAIRLFLKQTAETNIIPLTFDYQVRASKSTLKAIAELESGDYTESTLDEFLEQKHAKN